MQSVVIYLKTEPPYRIAVMMAKDEVERLAKDWNNQFVAGTDHKVRYGTYAAQDSHTNPSTVMIRFDDILAIG